MVELIKGCLANEEIITFVDSLILDYFRSCFDDVLSSELEKFSGMIMKLQIKTELNGASIEPVTKSNLEQTMSCLSDYLIQGNHAIARDFLKMLRNNSVEYYKFVSEKVFNARLEIIKINKD